MPMMKKSSEHWVLQRLSSPGQALFNVDHGSPLPSSFEEGLSFRDRSNTVPRVGPKEDGSGGLGVNIEWDFGMKGEKWSL